MTNAQITTILYQALESTRGLVVSTNNPASLKQKLYSVRRKLQKDNILDFDNFTFRTSPSNPEGELWIVKKEL